jgi:AcrR family transcriptional regulator
MALYRHVGDRRELLDLAADQAIADVALPDPALDDRAWLIGMTSAVRERLLQHPGAAEHLMLHGPTGPHSFAFMNDVCTILRRSGRSAPAVAHAYDWLMSTVVAYVSKESRLAAGDRPAERTGALAERTGRYMAQHPQLMEVVRSFSGDLEAAYRRSTGAVIDAIVGRRSRRRAPGVAGEAISR